MDKNKVLEKINRDSQNTLIGHLNIVFTGLTENTLTAEMPVNEKTKQPYGMLHGGASAALAETVGSYLSNIIIDDEHIALGTQINAHHVRNKKDGVVTATAKILKKGRSLHVTEIEIRDEKQELICFCTMTNMVIKREI